MKQQHLLTQASTKDFKVFARLVPEKINWLKISEPLSLTLEHDMTFKKSVFLCHV